MGPRDIEYRWHFGRSKDDCWQASIARRSVSAYDFLHMLCFIAGQIELRTDFAGGIFRHSAAFNTNMTYFLRGVRLLPHSVFIKTRFLRFTFVTLMYAGHRG